MIGWQSPRPPLTLRGMYDVRDDDGEEEQRGRSRGRMHRDQRAHGAALARLATRMIEMSVHAPRKLPLPEAMLAEVELGASIAPGPGSGHRRQREPCVPSR